MWRSWVGCPTPAGQGRLKRGPSPCVVCEQTLCVPFSHQRTQVTQSMRAFHSNGTPSLPFLSYRCDILLCCVAGRCEHFHSTIQHEASRRLCTTSKQVGLCESHASRSHKRRLCFNLGTIGRVWWWFLCSERLLLCERAVLCGL